MILSDSKYKILHKYNKPINWNVSGFGNDIITWILIRYIKYLKDLNIENPFTTVHGSYISKYNGGRTALFIRTNQYIYDKIREFNSLNVGVKLTFSNPYITEDMFEEKELREYLEVLNERKNLKNGIICSVDKFADFIHKNYPNIEVTSSYVKMATETKLGVTDTIDYYNKLFDTYDIIVCNNYRAYDQEFLDNIKYKNRIEFIINNSCNLNCPIAHKHYEAMYELSQRIKYLYDNKIFKTDPQVTLIQNKLNNINNNCKLRRLELKEERLKYQQFNRDELNKLLDLGINNFKIEGRDTDYLFYRAQLFKYIFIDDSIFSYYPIIPSKEEIDDFYSHKIMAN